MEKAINSVLISGAANGIGAACVEKFIEQGCRYIIALDRDEASLKAMQLRYADGDIIFIAIAADLTGQAYFSKLASALEPLTQLEALVLSHGVADENEINERDTFMRVMDVNVNSCQSIIAQCEAKLDKGSAVLFMSSILGKMGNHRNTAYCSSKHAQLGMMKGLAMDWARHGIRVNAILPCYVDTPLLRKELQKQADMVGSTLDQVMRKAKKRIPMRSYVQSSDVADSAYFLCSQQARMITAQSLIIDGGSSCGG
ncbi:SDR family oxidoreductase [Pseudoalteromonas sp. NEC-BIFX-2020_015]|uniref:SDR family NAD(P)-dependent oxidoreductase n=1 Tax=Pseudoalteromonas sp. NEC-BIFX-2020_015 TaxID=2729544 RepID=UPI00146143ED|nr:SDR family oxidoreductase [Pseudoalteromonas sp. NEC-BIFX-2020_015]NMR24263.1 SDR family oxidoreductase [Pseudoalteromonas sp. NEC-BIFX-2020_015]